MKTLLPKIIGQYINVLSRIAPDKAAELAFYFFSKPRKGFITADNLPPILQSAKIDFLNHNSISFPVYQWKQSGPEVLLVHGWESNAARWEPFIELLVQHNFSVISFDGPAHGMAGGKLFSIPDMAGCIATIQNEFKNPYLIGHSVGGTASVYYQHHFKDAHLEKMAIIGAPSDLNKLIDNYNRLLGFNSKTAGHFRNFFEEKLEGKIEAFSAQRFAESIEIPGLIYHDKADEVVLIDEAHKITQGWKDAVLKTTEGLGHSMHDDTLYRDIIAWLKK